MGNEQSIRHEPTTLHSTTPTSTKPVRSAIRRSRSVRSEADSMVSSQDTLRYMPKMNGSGNGLVMPTRPYGNDHTGNGVESPQWGWYINTTPPTPEMYHSHSSISHKMMMEPSQKVSPRAAPDVKGHQNHVFQNLQDKAPQIGWPSVPI